MGTNTLTTKTDGEVISSDDPNQYKTALGVDVVPRNSSGVPTANAGGLGTSSTPFKSAHVTAGHFFTGMIMPFHDFNGTLTPGQGWMKCNGDVVNKTNYDAIHGAGSWDTYVGSSALDGKNLPDLDDKYLVGANSTTQDGSGAITSVGDEGHVSDHIHSHNHIHQWYISNGTTSDDETYNSNGAEVTIDANKSATKTGGANTGHWFIKVNDDTDLGAAAMGTSYTSGVWSTGSTDSNTLASATAIQPESIEVQYWMRIV